MKLHRFYHMDRNNSLFEGQELTLNCEQVSLFGSVYWASIFNKPFDELNADEKRESEVDSLRQNHFQENISRLQAFFGARTIEEIKLFAAKIEPKPAGKVPVYEVFASGHTILDMRWLDYTPDYESRIQNYCNYWSGAITNFYHIDTGQALPPLMEVLMALPVKVGKIVEWI